MRKAFFIIIPLFLLSCNDLLLSQAGDGDDPSGNGSGSGTLCLSIDPCDGSAGGSGENPDPTIGGADSDDLTADLNDDTTPDEDPEELCDLTVDKDGDGQPCSCDSNDNSALITAVTANCDSDGDGIPYIYDLCPRSDNTSEVTFVYLCDDDQEPDDGLYVDVDYDEGRWTGASCNGMVAQPLLATKNPTANNPGDITAPTAYSSVDFIVSYIFPDDNDNGRADCLGKFENLGTLDWVMQDQDLQAHVNQ